MEEAERAEKRSAHDLAVVIVNYNAGRYLSRAVGSAFDSSGDAELEVVVVDNASADPSADGRGTLS